MATGAHGAGYLLATVMVAWLVFAKFGVSLLTSAWLNLDLIWALALVITGVLTLST